MNRPIAFALFTLALLGCEEGETLPEDPPYAVPGVKVTEPPMPGRAALLAPGAEPPTFDPELAVPGQPSPIPPPPMPEMPQVPPEGMQPGPVPPEGMQPGQLPPEGMQPGQVPPEGTQPAAMP